MRPMKYKKEKVPSFILKLYTMLNDQKSESIIEWTPQKDAFAILDLNQFTQTILPQYFKHSNYSSFIRQLNMYNFTKKRQDGIVGTDEHIYFNQNFLCNDQSKLKDIRRKQICNNKPLNVPIRRSQYQQQISEEEEDVQKDNISKTKIEKLENKIIGMKSKQQKLKSIVCHMIQQNQLLISQNKELALKYKRQARKKDRIIDQVFRIVGASITQFWSQLCEQAEILEQKTDSLQQLYCLLIEFINKNDMNFILKMLDLFLMKNDEKKVKIFNIVSQDEENLFRSQNQEEINAFISATRLLQKKNNQ